MHGKRAAGGHGVQQANGFHGTLNESRVLCCKGGGKSKGHNKGKSEDEALHNSGNPLVRGQWLMRTDRKSTECRAMDTKEDNMVAGRLDMCGTLLAHNAGNSHSADMAVLT